MNNQNSQNENEYTDKWYARYPITIVMGGMAYICYLCSINNTDLHGVGLLLFNPITGCLCALIAILTAWEVSLLLLALGVLFLLFKGVSMLPIPVTIILGATIIAASIWKLSKQR